VTIILAKEKGAIILYASDEEEVPNGVNYKWKSDEYFVRIPRDQINPSAKVYTYAGFHYIEHLNSS
jgi:hypothetical protein